MRIPTILASIATLAIGLTLWHFARLAGNEENVDGTVQAIEVLFYQVLSLPFFIASILVLLLGDRILRANRKVTPRPEASMRPGPRASRLVRSRAAP
jgi:hypothetical protein